MRWFRKAAEHGYAKAQYNLGAFYEAGIGVTKDTAEARRWYQKAAAQGYEKAQEALRQLGHSVP